MIVVSAARYTLTLTYVPNVLCIVMYMSGFVPSFGLVAMDSPQPQCSGSPDLCILRIHSLVLVFSRHTVIEE